MFVSTKNEKKGEFLPTIQSPISIRISEKTSHQPLEFRGLFLLCCFLILFSTKLQKLLLLSLLLLCAITWPRPVLALPIYLQKIPSVIFLPLPNGSCIQRMGPIPYLVHEIQRISYNLIETLHIWWKFMRGNGCYVPPPLRSAKLQNKQTKNNNKKQ